MIRLRNTLGQEPRPEGWQIKILLNSGEPLASLIIEAGSAGDNSI